MTDSVRPVGIVSGRPSRPSVETDPRDTHEREDLLRALRRQQRELEARNASLEAINSVASAVSSSLNYATVVARAADALVTYTQPRALVVLSIAEGRDHCEPVLVRGLSEDGAAMMMRVPIAHPFLQEVLTRREVYSLDDTNGLSLGALDALCGRSLLCVPLVAHETVLGVLLLAFPDRRAPIGRERETLVSIGRTLGMAMANAQHVERIAAAMAEREQAQRERAELEAQLRQAQRMETIGRLAGGIAHDFNNMLTPILTAAQLAHDDADPGQQELREDLQMIVSSAQRAAALVRQILLFSRDVRPDRQPVDCGQLIKEAMRLIRASLPTTIEVRQRIEPGVDNVQADPVQLHQVLLNLCTNAAHAMRDGGGVLTVSLDAEPPPDALCQANPVLSNGPVAHIAVRDTGRGMDADTAERVFEPFFTTKDVGEGTGLGLSVVHGIVINHGGAIDVETAVDNGTVFHLYLPGLTVEHEVLPVRPVRPRVGRERVLLVDDETSVARIAARLLTRLGYEVVHTSSAQEALDTFRARPYDFDIVLTDQTMPKLTGSELSAQLREVRNDLPIVLMTGHADESTQAWTASGAVDGVLLKPFDASSLGEAIRTALDR